MKTNASGGSLAANLLAFDALWAMEERAARTAWSMLSGTDAAAHVAEYHRAVGAHERAPITVRGGYVGEGGSNGWDYKDPNGAANRGKPYKMDGTVAILELTGPMTKQGSSFSDGGSTVSLRRQVRQASKDADVTAICLLVDSPGGQVSGTSDLAADVAKAAQKKPLYSYIEDCGASAAYWVASQANAVYAGKSALVGSIGTYMVVQDLSKMAEGAGVNVEVFRAGDYKGAGEPGTALTDAHRQHFQSIVDSLNSQFLASVGKARGLSLTTNTEPSDGRVYIGAQARAKGLVDGITSLDTVVAKLKNYRP